MSIYTLLLLLTQRLPSSANADESYNFGNFVTYFCDNDDSQSQLSAASPMCDISVQRELFTKTILLRAYQQPKLIRCNGCNIGVLYRDRSLHISIEVMTVDLSDSHIEHIAAEGIVGTFKILVLAHNQLQKLDEIKLFAKTPQLTALDLAHNRIDEITARAFNGLPHLKTLWLCFNNIVWLNTRTFENLPKLRILKLHNNYLRTIESKLFSRNVHLNELTLFNNSLEFIEGDVLDRLKAIEFLDMPNVWNQLTINGKSNKFYDYECHMGGHMSHFAEMRMINLSCNHLTALSMDQLKGLQFKYLNIRHNDINTLSEPYLFSNVAEVNAIDLSHNQIEDINPEVFSGIEKLEILWLDHNNITSLDRQTFSNLPNLLILHLRFNRLQTIDTNLFWHNIKLNELSLNDNNIELLGDNVFDQLQQLEILDISDNSIENDVLISVNAKMVNLSRSGVSYLNVGSRVRILDASSNRISSINMDTARNLGRINLANNKISTIDLSNQRNLRFIDLTDNSLTYISFTTNEYLTDVRLSRNYLESVSFRSIQMLEKVDLSSNFLRSVYLGEVFNLIDLNLSNNLLTSLQNVSQIHSLRYLDLSFNQLTDVQSHSFQNLENLEVLNLKSSGIQKIMVGLFEHQVNLRQLDISYNSLNEIDILAFGILARLEDLIVNGNNLSDLDGTALLRIFPYLDKISISDNAWECRRLQAILAFFQLNYVQVMVESLDIEPVVQFNGIGCSKNTDEDYDDETNRYAPENYNLRIVENSTGVLSLSRHFVILLSFFLLILLRNKV